MLQAHEIIGFDDTPPAAYVASGAWSRDIARAASAHEYVPPRDDAAHEAAQSAYEAECWAMAFGPIGGDDAPPARYTAHTPKRPAARGTRRTRRAEPGNRRVRKVLRRATRVGVSTPATYRAWVEHAFATMPSPDRLARLIREHMREHGQVPAAA